MRFCSQVRENSGNVRSFWNFRDTQGLVDRAAPVANTGRVLTQISEPVLLWSSWKYVWIVDCVVTQSDRTPGSSLRRFHNYQFHTFGRYLISGLKANFSNGSVKRGRNSMLYFHCFYE